MLTPAEELGLSGHSLDGRLRQVFYSLSPNELAELEGRVVQAAVDRHLVYLHEGRPEPIHIFLRPLAVLPEQLGYLHYVSLTILNALKRLPALYFEDEAVRRVFPLSEGEQRWLHECWQPAQRESNPVLGRLDAVLELTSPMWKDSLKFLEPNLSGVGGIYLGPTCDRVLEDVVLPAVASQAEDVHLECGRDLRDLLIQEVADHLEAIGRHGRNLCFVEPKYAGEGPDEQESLCAYYHDRHGMRIMHADPRELELHGDEIYYEGNVVDMAYRDYEVRDLLALEQSEGAPLWTMRRLFRENRVISSLTGEFDHKSCWELLTDPELTERYFNSEERQVFRRHILWTRILSDRKTTLPEGGTADLLSFVREEREMLVIKPNRAYGGTGVLIGHLTSERDWDAAIETALRETDGWVVQRQAILPVTEWSVIAPSGEVHLEPFHVVFGFAPTRYGLSIVGRASQKQVVNVAQRGGMCSILIGHRRGQLRGPARR